METLQARREWQDIFKVLKGKNLRLRLLYLARISFKIDGEIKSFSDKQKLRESSTTKAMAPHSSTLAWKIPWTEEPGRLQSMGSLGVRHD